MNHTKLFVTLHWNRRTSYLVLLLLFLFQSCTPDSKKETSFEDLVDFSGHQLELLIQQTDALLSEGPAADRQGRELVVPRALNADGSLHLIPSRDWVSGFFPGTLWFMYQFTGQPKWKEAAEKYTVRLEQEQFNGGTHDMGFKMMCSYGKGYELTGNPAYRDVLIQSARTLITRYNPVVGAIRSWDHNRDKWQYPVIIDNMMNLELLFWASRETGDPVFSDIAVQHARTTLASHFREDHSSFHVIDFDTLTGAIQNRHTHQGLSHGSAWARGQAWGLYGFTMCYRETGIPEFLDQARRIADYYLSHPNLPSDMIPYWDFDVASGGGEPRDVSAACIAASGLYELAGFLPAKKAAYEEAAGAMLQSLNTSYRSAAGGNHGFILMHSTGNKPSGSEVDVPIIYAEYYYLEALRRQNFRNGKNNIQ